ncbi:hypothetical protein V5O48_005706 [Marasmius crinis-equi]|uniref:Peptidase A1 domain-containing protein n=1 Tax=Marasmius crinis-equi TaxID=585013 RepID=A0ABR3FME6_9AGAR
MTYTWKGKRKATPEEVERWRRDDGSDDSGGGGGTGSIFTMDYVGTSAYDQTYVVPLKVGSNQQAVSLQVDTGSGDLWIASSSCSSCNSAARKYDPNSSQSAQSSNVAFTINYLRGKASGTIYWDTVNVGGYNVENQALAAATDVQEEPLSDKFNGVLGLALPRNSVISTSIPPGTSGGRDGAHITSNLFSVSPQSSAPAARFISMTFSRPGSKAIPSLMGIGKHPSNSQIPSITNGTQVKYSTPLASTNAQGLSVGNIFWKTSVRDITVWVDSQPRVVQLSRSGIGGSGGGGAFPTAVLDTGIPLIFSTRAIADAIYGAVGISRASDGFCECAFIVPLRSILTPNPPDYMDCKTPLNLTITLDDRPPIPLHPLDLSTEPSRDATSSNCVGIIQAADGDLQNAGVADMILGVPFIRNTYMVMAYQTPNSDGTFPDLRQPDSNPPTPVVTEFRPSLGLQGLTDPTVALNEFNRVRVQGLPIDGDGNRFTGSSDDKKKINVGLEILFGLIGFVVFCIGLFGLRWCLLRRKYAAAAKAGGAHPEARRGLGAASDAGATAISNSGLFGWWKNRKQEAKNEKKGTYELAVGRWSEDDILPHEDVLRQRRFDEYMRKERMKSEYTVDSARTRIDDDDEPAWRHKQDPEALGDNVVAPVSARDTTGHAVMRPNADWNPARELDWGENRATLVERDSYYERPKTAYDPTQRDSDNESSPERAPILSRQLSGGDAPISPPPPTLAKSHSRRLSETPLLPPVHELRAATPISPMFTDDDLAEFGSLSMAGVGTAARQSRIDPDFRQSVAEESPRVNSSSPTSLRPTPSPVDEFASQNRPVSATSTRSSHTRGRPTRTPTGPRQSAR